MDEGPELARERAVLRKADHDIAEGERRIAAQERILRHLRESGGDAREAEHLLRLLETTLSQWREHRILIVDRISHLEGRLEAGRAASRSTAETS